MQGAGRLVNDLKVQVIQNDQILEPGMAEGGNLAPVFSWLVGTGTGAGIALLFIVTGLLAAMAGLGGYFFRVVRDVEDILPDHDTVVSPA